MRNAYPSSDSDDEAAVNVRLLNPDIAAEHHINGKDWKRKMKERAERGDLREDFEDSDSDDEVYLDVEASGDDVSVPSLTSAHKLDMAQRRKAEGVEAFRVGEWSTARGHFQAALVPLKYEFDFFDSDSDTSSYVDLHASCLLNAAQCELKLSQWSSAVALCTRALKTQLGSASLPVPLKVKALFRRGTAQLKMSEYGLARADLKAANQLDPKSAEIRAAYASIGQAEAAAKQTEVARFSGKLGWSAEGCATQVQPNKVISSRPNERMRSPESPPTHDPDKCNDSRAAARELIW